MFTETHAPAAPANNQGSHRPHKLHVYSTLSLPACPLIWRIKPSTYSVRRFHILRSEWDRVFSRLTIVPGWIWGTWIRLQPGSTPAPHTKQCQSRGRSRSHDQCGTSALIAISLTCCGFFFLPNTHKYLVPLLVGHNFFDLRATLPPLPSMLHGDCPAWECHIHGCNAFSQFNLFELP
jgi:hypothetical protein